jgi:hypothetical protein
MAMGREVSGSITYAVETADNFSVGTALIQQCSFFGPGI